MKKTIPILTIIAALALSLAGCGNAPAAQTQTPAPGQSVASDAPLPPEEGGQAALSGTEGPGAAAVRQDGERFETVIVLEGIEETVRCEHIRSEAVGFEMDYDYETFTRRREGDRELFLSLWDDPENPENYLEVTYSPENADTAAASVSEALSDEYDLIRESYALEGAGPCVRIDASGAKGGLGTPDLLQTVYIIPAPDGCRVAAAHYSFESAEGFGRRFSYLLNTLTVIDRTGEGKLSEEQALSAVRSYCYRKDPELKGIVDAGEYPVYWDVSSGDGPEIVVLFRSYTGALIRYYIDPVTGETYVTEFVPGITPEEMRTEESFNVRNYLSGDAAASDPAISVPGTWQTASMGIEADGTVSPEYYVRFTDSAILYGHGKDGAFVPDHSDRIARLESPAAGRFRVQAEAANGVRYTYQTSESDENVLEYYETWNEKEFPEMYRGGASLSRSG